MFYSLLSENAGATDHSIMLVGLGTLATCRTAGQIAKPDQKRRLNQVPYKDPKFVFLFLSWPFSLFL